MSLKENFKPKYLAVLHYYITFACVWQIIFSVALCSPSKLGETGALSCIYSTILLSLL